MSHWKTELLSEIKGGRSLRANKTVRESLSDKVIIDFGDAEKEIATTVL